MSDVLQGFNFYCINDDCPEDDMVVRNTTKDYFEEIHNENCDICGERLKLVGQAAFSTASFRMKSPEDKKKVLLKRSKDHFKKRIAEKKRLMLKGKEY